MRTLRLFLVLVTLGALAGCRVPSLADLPLPGGAPSGAAFHVTAEFSDVLDLVPRAAVKVNDVTVGSVEKITLSGWMASVKLRVDKTVSLPANATAAIRQTSLLGEKYVALDRPVSGPGRGRLADGSVIPLSQTQRSAEVEEVLAALGLLLNGGGLAQLKTINQELGTALGGREAAAKDALNQLDTFIGGLDRQKADLVRAIDALDQLSGHLAEQRAVIGKALDALAPGLTVLAQQREQLTTALTALGQLGVVGTRVIAASRDDTLASLKALQPVLGQLAKAGDNLPKSLNFLLSFPFPPNVTGAIVGDYVNLGATADLDATTILHNLLVAPPMAPPSVTGPVGNGSGSGATGSGNGGRRKPGGSKPPNQPGLPLPPLPPVIGVLPLSCLPLSGLLPPGWVPPNGCHLPTGCVIIAPGSPAPPGSVKPPGGIIQPGSVFPPGTLVLPGAALSPQCLLPPATGATNSRSGSLTDILSGGLLP
jgi:phospholipid/cholesterol/gamma-HCH transport system substrate-binding protein